MDKTKRLRGFEFISSYPQGTLKGLPKRSTMHSAAYDFFTPKTFTIPSKSTYILRTGVKAYMLQDEVLILNVRSSMGINRNITLANTQGWIDSDYYNNLDNEGEIMFALKNNSIADITFEVGDKIGQGMFIKYLKADDDDNTTKTRVGGIGSTGK